MQTPTEPLFRGLYYHKQEIRRLGRLLRRANSSQEYYDIMRQIGEHHIYIKIIRKNQRQYNLFYQR